MKKQPEQKLQDYLNDRWQLLSKETREAICEHPEGLAYTQLLWTKQYWEARAKRNGEEW